MISRDRGTNQIARKALFTGVVYTNVVSQPGECGNIFSQSGRTKPNLTRQKGKGKKILPNQKKEQDSWGVANICEPKHKQLTAAANKDIASEIKTKTKQQRKTTNCFVSHEESILVTYISKKQLLLTAPDTTAGQVAAGMQARGKETSRVKSR